MLRGYIRAIAVLVKDREKSVEIMRNRVDKLGVSEPENTLEISHRVAPKLAGIDINRYLYFTPVQRLETEGFIDRLYK